MAQSNFILKDFLLLFKVFEKKFMEKEKKYYRVSNRSFMCVCVFGGAFFLQQTGHSLHTHTVCTDERSTIYYTRA